MCGMKKHMVPSSHHALTCSFPAKPTTSTSPSPLLPTPPCTSFPPNPLSTRIQLGPTIEKIFHQRKRSCGIPPSTAFIMDAPCQPSRHKAYSTSFQQSLLLAQNHNWAPLLSTFRKEKTFTRTFPSLFHTHTLSLSPSFSGVMVFAAAFK